MPDGDTAVHGALAPSVADRVTLKSAAGGRVRITNRGTVALFYRLDGTDPQVNGLESFVVLPGASDVFSPTSTPVEVRLISDQAVPYSVSVMQ